MTRLSRITAKPIQINSEYAEAYYARSEAYDCKGDSDKACVDSYEALKLGFDLQSYAEDSNMELIEDLVQLCPKNAKIYYCRGLVHHSNGDYNLAISDYSDAIKLDPKYAEAYHGRGTAYYYKAHKEEDKAIADYNEAIRHYDAYSSGRAEVIRARGLIYENRETIDGYSKAIADYEWAARSGPLHYYELALNVYFKRGKLYAENSNYDSAIADMRCIIELDDSISTDRDEGFRRGPAYDDSYPSNYGSVPAGQAYNDRGFYYYKKGEYDSAIADFTEVIRIYNERVELIPESNPDFAIIYLNLGSIYQAKMDYDTAIENYDNVVRLCLNYETDFIESKFVHGGQDAVEVAIKLLRSRVNNLPQNADNFYYTGLQALFSNDRYSAELAFQIALLLDYDDKEKIQQHLTNLKNQN